ncbi:MAG: TetR family transcriptional regulator [Nitriliruptorales bacterium]|nr:TetR family transcriptional regulator [Nitriliruptorales bacterium]
MASRSNTEETTVPAADGRIPGRRGTQTRERLLDATAEMLTSTSYRDLKVVDIARAVGTSPATFYQYFADVESAVLLLGQRLTEDAHELTAPIEAGDWLGTGSYDAALALVDAFLDFWRSHEAVLRVVDLAIVEGDRRFREIRNKVLYPVTKALTSVVASASPRTNGRAVDPTAQAAVLVSMLAHVAEHRRGNEAWGIDRDEMRHALAETVRTSVVGAG